MSAITKLRCAVYTRKSTEDGLEQEFNSLDAQRDACSSFIASQAGLGWKLVSDRYDDGGISGGTMERPALRRLLDDIRDKKVDVVVVYKIDRLTRSLTDFARIVEVFDTNGVSFVSVTQQFNTTTSMGRLTLNILLSFAQFEREVTTERIRDKIAASKRKGIWMGGTVSLGYQVQSRKLLIKEPEASFVRGLFTRYLELKSVPKLAAEVTRQAIAEEQRDAGETGIAEEQHAAGEAGRPGVEAQAKPPDFTRRIGSGMMYKLLANPIYIGKLRHRDNVHDGEHEPIVDAKLFDQVQQLMASQAATPRGSIVHKDVHLLTGLLFDDTGDRMSPTHAKARGKRFRYYISSRINGKARTDTTAWRIPAIELETVVVRFGQQLLGKKTRLLDWLATYDRSADRQTALDAAAILSAQLGSQSGTERRSILAAMFSRISLGADAISFDVDVTALMRRLVKTDTTSAGGEPDNESTSLIETLTLPIQIKRRGNEVRMVIDGPDHHAEPDPSLVSLIAKAHVYLTKLIEEPTLNITDLADRLGVDRVDVGRVLPLAFLAPWLTDQILAGTQPTDLSARHLARLNLPLTWSDQLQAIR